MCSMKKSASSFVYPYHSKTHYRTNVACSTARFLRNQLMPCRPARTYNARDPIPIHNIRHLSSSLHPQKPVYTAIHLNNGSPFLPLFRKRRSPSHAIEYYTFNHTKGLFVDVRTPVSALLPTFIVLEETRSNIALFVCRGAWFLRFPTCGNPRVRMFTVERHASELTAHMQRRLARGPRLPPWGRLR